MIDILLLLDLFLSKEYFHLLVYYAGNKFMRLFG